MEVLSREVANAAYDILVRECGACDHKLDRGQFVFLQMNDEDCRNYVFESKLGLDGKLVRDGTRMFVDCGKNEVTAARKAIIGKANKSLAAL